MLRAAFPSALATVKRRVYLLGLPLGALTTLFVWLLEHRLGVLPAVDRYGLPLLGVLAVLLWFGFWRKHNVRRLELILFVSFSLFLSSSLLASLLTPQTSTLIPYASTGYWFPVLYGLAFLMFGGPLGRLLSLALFVVSLLLGLIYVTSSGRALDGSDALVLVQLYISNGLVILLLNGFARLAQLQNEHAVALERAAYSDSLTGLGNRRLLEREIGAELGRVERYGKPFALVLFDLDHFKAVNDRYGHDAGDAVLREVARTLRFYIRQVDVLGRWGGEEFMLLAPELGFAEAEAFAERLRQVLEGHDFGAAHDPGFARVTASFGVSVYQPGDTAAALVKRADEALYQSKALGRNRVSVSLAPDQARTEGPRTLDPLLTPPPR